MIKYVCAVWKSRKNASNLVFQGKFTCPLCGHSVCSSIVCGSGRLCVERSQLTGQILCTLLQLSLSLVPDRARAKGTASVAFSGDPRPVVMCEGGAGRWNTEVLRRYIELFCSLFFFLPKIISKYILRTRSHSQQLLSVFSVPKHSYLKHKTWLKYVFGGTVFSNFSRENPWTSRFPKGYSILPRPHRKKVPSPPKK